MDNNNHSKNKILDRSFQSILKDKKNKGKRTIFIIINKKDYDNHNDNNQKYSGFPRVLGEF